MSSMVAFFCQGEAFLRQAQVGRTIVLQGRRHGPVGGVGNLLRGQDELVGDE